LWFGRLNIVLLIAAIALVVSGCGRDRRDSAIVRVGSSELKAEELKRMLPEVFEGRLEDEDVYIFIENWKNEVVFAEAAMALGLDNKEETAYQLRKARRTILASAFEREFIMPRIEVDSAEVQADYKENVGRFSRDRDEVRCLHIMVTDSAIAEAIAGLLDSVEFEELVERYSVGSDIEGTDYYAREEMHPKLANAAFSLPEGEAVGPIETEFGFHFIKLLDFAPKGSIRELQNVRENIYDLLIERKFKEIYAEILDSLTTVKNVVIDTAAIMRNLDSDD